MKKLVFVGGVLSLACAVWAEAVPASVKEITLPLPKGAKVLEVGPATPLKTLEVALDEVAKIRTADVKTPLALRVAPGDYAPGKTLEITPAHAATNFGPLVIFAADFAKKPHIIGGLPLKGWKKVRFHGRDDVWVTDATALKKKAPRIILYNGKKMPIARWPNLEAAGNPYKGGFVKVGKIEPKDAKPYEDELWRSPEDVRKWAHPEEGTAIIFPRHYYGTQSAKIVGVSNRIIRLERKHNALHGLHIYDMWHVVNIAEELDLPGEWYFDSREEKIYFITPDGADPNRAAISATMRSQPVMRMTRANHCTLAGLELSGGSDGIFFEGDSHFVNILACSIHDIGGDNHGGGGSGLNLRGKDLRIADCDIYNVGNYGIWHNSCGPSTVENRQRNVVENNYFHHIGRVGIWNFGQGLTFKNNLVHDIDGSAISGYGRFCDFAYNRIRHVCITAQDTGALYDSGWGNGTETKIRYNWISDVIGKHGNSYYCGACGIYFDECTGGAFVYGNLIERAHWAAMHLHCGRWITVTNNVFVWNSQWGGSIYSWQLSMSNWGPWRARFGNAKLHIGEYNHMVKVDPNWKKFPAYSQDANTDEVYANDGTMMMGNRFERNIIYYPGQAGSGQLLNASFLNVSTNTFNNNIYWAGGQEVNMNTHHSSGNSFAAWRARGGDKDTLVVDPLFVDPQKSDYRLRPESPAYDVGFVDLPFEKMGLQKTALRPELPKEVEGLREHPEWLK